MALVVKDRVKEVTTTTGTSNLTLGGAVYGFQSFSVIGNGNTTYYGIYDSATGDWEVGVGTYSTTGPTLTRDTVLESSNSGSKVVFGAGTKDVFVTYPAERSVYLDAAGSAVTVLDVGTLGVSTANISTANITAGTISTTPTSSNDLVNKTYVDAIAAQGISYHTPVKYEVPNTTGNLTATYNNGASGVGATLTNAGTQAAFAPDGPTAQVGDRILVYNQTNAYENGVYEVSVVGSGSTNWVLIRAADADSYGVKDPNALGAGDAFYVTSGNTGAGETYVCNTAGTITFGTTAITFAQISSAQVYSAGAGLTLSNLQFSITPVGTASTYGSSSSVPVFTTNAYGQVTSVTNTGIAISAGAVSGLAASATTDTTNASNITSGTLGSARLTGSYTGITGVGTLTAGTWTANTIGAAYGGTGITSYTVGDILYADGATSLAKLADVATGNALLSGGVGTAPAWGKIGLQTHVSGTLQVTNGGTGATDAPTARSNLGLVIGTDVPSPTGTGASGTWNISISGNAATATTATTSTTATQVSNSVTFNNSGTGAASGNGFNGSSALTVSYNTIGAPSTTGTNASGTWSISISGNAATASNASQLGGKPPQDAPGANTIPTRDGSGYVYFNYINSNTGNSENPTVSQVIVTNGSDNFYRKASIAHLTSSLSGTAPINITGSAGSSTTSTYSTYLSSVGSYVWNNATASTGYVNGISNAFVSAAEGFPSYGDVMTMNSYPGGGGALQLYSPYGSAYPDLNLRFRTADYSAGGAWTAWKIILDSANYNNYAPTLTGTGASGTWSINITGSAGSSGSVTGLTLTSSANGINPDSVTQNQLGYNTSVSLYGQTDGGLYSSAYSSSWIHQIYGDFRSGQIAVRGKNSGTWQSWYYIPTYSLNNGYSGGSLYAGIYYDSNDTAYYLDPNSGAYLAANQTSFVFEGGANSSAGPTIQSSSAGGPKLAIKNTSAGGKDIWFISNGSSNADGAGKVQLWNNTDGYTAATFATTSSMVHMLYGAYTQMAGSSRAPLFYDSDNTAYYADPASTSSLSTVLVGYNSAAPNVYDVASTGSLTFGTTSDTTNYSIKTVLENYNGNYSKLSLYWYTGIRYYAHNYYGGHRFYDITGTQYLSIGSGSGQQGVIATYNMQAPLFYDSDNTGYYVDPASTSNVNRLNLVGFDSSGRNYSREWIEFPNFSGLYSPNNGAHFYPNNQSSYGSWATSGSRNGWAGIQDTYSAVNGIMYDSAGNGGAYREANGRWYFYYHLSNDCMGIGTSSTSSTYSLYLNKGVYAQSRIDATIYYDTNDTSYYMNPNSTSSLHSATCWSTWYFRSNVNTASGSNPPLQAYSDNGSGAIMAFHRGGYYAVNMGLDSDNVIRIGGWSAAANRLQMDMSGNLTMAGSVTAFSDERLKKDWADLSDDFIERLAAVKAGTYTRIDSGERQAGSSAQDWQELLPEVVSEDAAGTLALAYGNAAVVACVELAKSVVALRAEIKALRAQ